MADAERPTPQDSLQQFHISSLPPNFYYVPNFITPEEEASILGKIPAQRWVSLAHRRLQAHPSTLLKGHTLLASPLPDWLIKPIIERFTRHELFANTPHKAPNHVLINEYNRGEGIMPHEDGAAYAPVVATISLGTPICLDITSKPCSSSEDVERSTPADGSDTTPYALPTRILQEPRSLLVTTGRAYTDLLHGISEVEVDDNLQVETVANWNLLADPTVFEKAGGRNERATRISLTYRDVLKVSGAALRVFGSLGKK